MIEITNKVSPFASCQACFSEAELYKITVSNSRISVEVHLCKKCCLQLKSLLACVNLDDVQMMSLDELSVDKLN